MNQTERANEMDQFQASENGIMIATNAAGQGIDIQDLHEVIVIGLVKSIVQLIQMLGRCGRSGIV